MLDYKTVEEKAAELGISSRHIQYLCRMGKVEGVVKRGGVWFIPNDVPIPVKNMKSGDKGFRYVGTRKKIFESAIKLFVLRGFNDVSLRDIASDVGIRQSTIYNHFKSKQEILDALYDFYCYYYLQERPSLQEMESKLQNESLMDIVGYIRYDFKEEYLQSMSDISKIIFQRIGIDGRAREIARSLMVDEGIKYVEEVFQRGIETGRIAPFDTHAMAVFINSLRIFTFYAWIIDPSIENMTRMLKDEQTLYRYAVKQLTDLRPPAADAWENRREPYGE